MRAIEIDEPGGPEVLKLGDRPTPEPGPGEVLIKVEAAGVNRPDALQRAGAYPPPPGASDIPGLEVAGEIVATGAEVERWFAREKVCALVAGGGYADYCVAPLETVLPWPKKMTAEQAAGLPETYFTVWHNVFERGFLDHGETLLVHGGSSGIGTTTIQLAKAFDATVITTAGSDEKCAFCRGLGADLAINYHQEDFRQAVLDFTEQKGVHLVLDMVGGDYIAKNIDCLGEDGRHVSIAFLGGAKAEINFAKVMMKRLILTGSTLRARPNAVKGAIAQSLERLVWPLLNDGKAWPVIDSVMPLKDAAAAHARMESSAHMGKIILKVDSDKDSVT